MTVFLLKQYSFLIQWLLLSSFLSQYPLLFVYLDFQRICLQCINTLNAEKKYKQPVLSFCFVLFDSNVIVFVYKELKQSLTLQTKPNQFLQISFFHRNFIYVYFTKASCAVCGETWVQTHCYVRHICLHLLFCFANLHWSYHEIHSSSQEKKSWQSLYIFSKPQYSMNVRYFELAWWYTSI